MAGGFPGRPPKPTVVKELQGNPGQREVGEEPTPDKGNEKTTTHCPPELKGEAFAEWNRLAPELYRLGLLTKVDRSYFQAYCESWGTYYEAMRYVEDHGIIIEGRQGPVKNPAMQVAKDSLDGMLKFGTRFGLSPADRARLAVKGGTEDDSPAKDDGTPQAAALRLIS
jgi:P27 family predicted phage terminase small subunit